MYILIRKQLCCSRRHYVAAACVFCAQTLLFFYCHALPRGPSLSSAACRRCRSIRFVCLAAQLRVLERSHFYAIVNTDALCSQSFIVVNLEARTVYGTMCFVVTDGKEIERKWPSRKRKIAGTNMFCK